MNYKYWKLTGIIATSVIVIMIPLSLIIHQPDINNPEEKANYVGLKNCVDCHQKEYNLWKNSDHDDAMDIATDSTVLGNFNNSEFKSKNGIVSKFYNRDGKYFTYTRGIGGRMGEHQIAYTFGVKPLQQYLIPFDSGKYQCLPIAWNTIKKEWFSLPEKVYSNEAITPDDWLYWTNQGQNWNGMCAECHSTNLQKNYNVEKKTFNTTWSEIDVSCEACHGPGSKHIDWAQLPEMARNYDSNMGLIIKTSGTTQKEFIDGCAPCHSRRSSLGPFDPHKPELMNNNIPQLPIPPNYYIDGQILNEDYVYGSFTQSKMYMNDVQCNDCHDSHSLKLKYDGNALCLQCHRAEEYDTYNHHFHQVKGGKGKPVIDRFGNKREVGEGALCINCHMPGQYYMGIDFRRDHSLRIPMPNLSIKFNTPNACNDCHADKSAKWSDDQITKWFGSHRKFHYSEILYEGSKNNPDEVNDLIKLAGDDLYPELIRAAAVTYLSAYRSPEIPNTMTKMLNGIEPIIRYTALENMTAESPEQLIKLISPLLSDPVKAVRIEAASKLAGFHKEQFAEKQYSAFTKALNEYKISLNYAADFPSGRFNLGNFYQNRKDTRQAELNYSEAIAIDNKFYPAKVNLAMLYYGSGDLERAEALLLDLEKNHREFTQSEYYLGLLYAEQKKYKQSAEYLETAAERNENNIRIYFNLGLIYQQLNKPIKAERALKIGYEKSPDNFDIIYALSDFFIKQRKFKKAKIYADILNKKFPGNQTAQEIISYLKNLQDRN